MIRTAIIGCEQEGMAYAAALGSLSDVEVVSIYDRSARVLAAARKRLPVENTYVRIEPLLEDSAVDAVVVATVGSSRQAIVRAALRAGKAVLVAGVEGFRCDDLVSLARLAERSGGIVAFGVPLVETDGFHQFRAQAAPALGRTGYVRVMRAERGAGPLMSMIAEESLALWRLLDVLPERAAAVAVVDGGSGEQAVFATLRFSTGVVAQIDITALEPGPMRQVTVAGEDRTVVLDERQTGSPVTVSHLQDERPAVHLRPMMGPPGDPIERVCRRFQAVVAGDMRQPDITIWDAASATAMAEAVRNSMGMLGAPVVVRPLNGDAERAHVPALRVIQGGGRGAVRPGRRAQLRLVSR